MQKVIPPRLVEPYLAGRRTVISGFVYRAADSSFGTPAEFYDALGLGYPGSDFTRDAAEIYVLRWIATDPGRYRIPYPAVHGRRSYLLRWSQGGRVLHRYDAGARRGRDLPDRGGRSLVRRALRRPGVDPPA